MAKLVPGKEEFYETLRYFNKQLQLQNVDVRLNKEVVSSDLTDYDAVVIATGVLPRKVSIPTSPDSTGKVQVLSYVDVLKGKAQVGSRVAVIGAGGIGFDVADYLTHPHPAPVDAATPTSSNPNADVVDEELVKSFLEEWGIDQSITSGGLRSKAEKGREEHVPRKIYLLQRKEGKLGSGLGKTTGKHYLY